MSSARTPASCSWAHLKRLDFRVPLVAFVGISIALWIAATTQGAPFFRSSSWIRWDSTFYLQIASSGYHLFRCTGAPYPPHSWCGNAGWFPGYSGVLAPLFDLGLPQGATAVVVSWIFAFALLVLLWNGFLRQIPGPSAYIAFGFAALAPGAIYTRAVFPMSMTLFFMLLCLLLLRRDRFWWAGAAVGVASVCYPTAILLAPVCVLWALLARREPLRPRLITAAGSGALACVGFLAALALAKLQTGSWTAYFKTQAKYHHGLHEPFSNLWPNIHSVIDGSRGVSALPAVEATVVAIMMVVVLGGYLVRLLRRHAARSELLLAVVVLLFWLGPLTQANVSYNRSDVFLTPSALLVQKLPLMWSVLLLFATGSLYCFIAFGFFQGVLT